MLFFQRCHVLIKVLWSARSGFRCAKILHNNTSLQSCKGFHQPPSGTSTLYFHPCRADSVHCQRRRSMRGCTSQCAAACSSLGAATEAAFAGVAHDYASRPVVETRRNGLRVRACILSRPDASARCCKTAAHAPYCNNIQCSACAERPDLPAAQVLLRNCLVCTLLVLFLVLILCNLGLGGSAFEPHYTQTAYRPCWDQPAFNFSRARTRAELNALLQDVMTGGQPRWPHQLLHGCPNQAPCFDSAANGRGCCCCDAEHRKPLMHVLIRRPALAVRSQRKGLLLSECS